MAKLVSAPWTCMSNTDQHGELFLGAHCARDCWLPPCAQACKDSRWKGAYHDGVFRGGGQPAAPRWDITHGRLENAVLANFGSSLDRRASQLRRGVHKVSKSANMVHVALWLQCGLGRQKNICPGTVHNRTTQYKALIRKIRCGAKDKHVRAYK